MKKKIKIQFHKELVGFLTAVIIMSRLGMMVTASTGLPIELPILLAQSSVTYDLNGGTGITPPKMQIKVGNTFAVASISEIIPPNGKRFKEWNTKSDGSGKGYSLGATVAMPSAGLKFYAIWRDIPNITIEPTSPKTTIPFVVSGKAIGGSKVNLKITGNDYLEDITGIDIQPDGIWSYIVDREECTGSISVTADLVNEEGQTLVSISSPIYILENNLYVLVGNVIWAADDVVESRHGSSGNIFNANFGDLKTENYDLKTIGWFFDWGESNIIKECINGLDNSEDTEYNGYLDITVNVQQSFDDYILNVLCFGENDGRLYEVTVNEESLGNTDVIVANASSSSAYTTRDGNILNVLQMEIPLNQGANIIRLQAPEGYKAPVFVAAAVVYLGIEKMGTPSASLEPGNYVGTQSITLTAEDDAKIYYTTDGSAPSETSTQFIDPITLPEGRTTILKAIAIKEGFRKSDIVAWRYVVDYEKVMVIYEVEEGGMIKGEKVQTIIKGWNTAEVTAEPEIGYIFVRWSDGKTGVTRKETNVQQDMTITAEFERKAIHRITLNPDGGKVFEGAIEVMDGEAVGTLPIPIKNGYEFVGWYDSKTAGTKITNETIVIKSMTIYARWEEEPLIKVQVKYAAGEGGKIEGNEMQEITVGEDAQEVTAVPGTGYIFLKWSDGKTMATRKEINVQQDMEIKAEFKKTEIIYRITLNPNGGIVSEQAREIKEGGEFGKLPIANKSGYKFMGWYSSETGGVKIASTMKATKSITIYARWEKISPIIGTTFKYGNLKYKIVKKATANTSGSVQVTGSVSTNLTKISIPNTVKYDTFIYKIESIKKKAFMDYKKLRILVIGNNVKKIHNKAFYRCTGLRKVTLGENIVKIENKAFCNADKLKNIIIKSKKLTKVGKNAFKNIHRYAIIQIPSGKGKKYKNMLKGKGQKKTVVIESKEYQENLNL